MQETDIQGHFGKEAANQRTDMATSKFIFIPSLPRLEYLQVHTVLMPWSCMIG